MALYAVSIKMCPPSQTLLAYIAVAFCSIQHILEAWLVVHCIHQDRHRSCYLQKIENSCQCTMVHKMAAQAVVYEMPRKSKCSIKLYMWNGLQMKCDRVCFQLHPPYLSCNCDYVIFQVVTEAVKLVEVPVQIRCPNCHRDVMTNVQHTSGVLTWLIVLFLCIIGCWW